MDFYAMLVKIIFYVSLNLQITGLLDEKYIISGLKNKDKVVFDFIFGFIIPGFAHIPGGG